MAQEPDQLKAQIDDQRREISGTIDQIENRVNPSHMLARRQDRVRRRLTNWKDSVFGNDEPQYPAPRYAYTAADDPGSDNGHGGIGHRVGDMASSASDTVQHAPTAVRRRTRGNPMAAGAIALGAGWLIGSMLPESRTEQRVARRVEPQLSDAADTVKDEARALADDLKEPAKQAADEVKQSGKEAATEIKDHGGQAARSAENQTTS